MSKTTKTEDNYLRAIYKLTEQCSTETVATNDLAAEIGASAASVTDMIKKLGEKALAAYTPYQGVSLTKEGREVGVMIRRNQIIWEWFLNKELNFDEKEAAVIASDLAVIRDEKLISALYTFLGNPQKSLDGGEIPVL